MISNRGVCHSTHGGQQLRRRSQTAELDRVGHVLTLTVSLFILQTNDQVTCNVNVEPFFLSVYSFILYCPHSAKYILIHTNIYFMFSLVYLHGCLNTFNSPLKKKKPHNEGCQLRCSAVHLLVAGLNSIDSDLWSFKYSSEIQENFPFPLVKNIYLIELIYNSGESVGS